MGANECRLSVIIPVFNERQSLRPLLAKLQAVLDRGQGPYEILYVDDGSTDGSGSELRKLTKEEKQVRALVFRRNFGKAAALSAGFHKARGEILITMDGDLQDDPEEIPALLGKLDEQLDLVSGWKYPRHDPLRRRIMSSIFNYVTRRVTGVPLHDFNCGFKAYRREAVEGLKLYGELYRFLPALVASRGYRVGEMKVRHFPRQFGRSKYGIERVLRGFFDLITVVYITKYQTRPMHLLGPIGMATFLAGVVINIYLTVRWFMGEGIGSRPLFFLGILLVVFGIQVVSLGVLAELITYTSHRPEDPYRIREELGD